jgi:pimeloyl-ACP methyl ester carboxylesterase
MMGDTIRRGLLPFAIFVLAVSVNCRMARVPLRERSIDRVHSRPCENRLLAVWKYFLELTGRAPIRTLGYRARWLDQVDLRPLLPEMHQPVLLVCGERDPLIGRSHAETLLQDLPNAGRVLIEGCGHTPSYTHPEVLAEVVRQFLTPVPSSLSVAPGATNPVWATGS